MNRALIAMAVGVLGLGMMGCATDVQDPLPQAPAPEAQRDPPEQPLNGALRKQPVQDVAAVDKSSLMEPGAKQRPPTPTPLPFAGER